MGFKMKGSAFKLGRIEGTSGHASALKQVVHSEGIGKEGYEHDLQEHSIQPMSESQAEQARYAMLDTKGKGDKTRYGDRKIAGRVQWIRENFGRGLNKKQQRKAEIAFYNAHPPTKTTYEAEGETPAVNTTETEVTPVTEKPMIKAIHEKGTIIPTEFSKAISKGYGSDFSGGDFEISPKPADFETLEEYTAAVKAYQEKYPKG